MRVVSLEKSRNACFLLSSSNPCAKVVQLTKNLSTEPKKTIFCVKKSGLYTELYQCSFNTFYYCLDGGKRLERDVLEQYVMPCNQLKHAITVRPNNNAMQYKEKVRQLILSILCSDGCTFSFEK